MDINQVGSGRASKRPRYDINPASSPIRQEQARGATGDSDTKIGWTVDRENQLFAAIVNAYKDHDRVNEKIKNCFIKESLRRVDN